MTFTMDRPPAESPAWTDQAYRALQSEFEAAYGIPTTEADIKVLKEAANAAKKVFVATNTPPRFLDGGRYDDLFERWNGVVALGTGPTLKPSVDNFYDTDKITFWRRVNRTDTGESLIRISGEAPDTPQSVLRRLDPASKLVHPPEPVVLPLSPDGRAIIDEWPGMPGVYFMGGFGGVGLTYSGVLREVLEPLLKTVRHPAPELWGMQRPSLFEKPIDIHTGATH
jgi:glycine/D-amino acid oxidase-like deaminating enzyme